MMVYPTKLCPYCCKLLSYEPEDPDCYDGNPIWIWVDVEAGYGEEHRCKRLWEDLR